MSRTLCLLIVLAASAIPARAQSVLSPVWERPASNQLTSPRIDLGPGDRIVVGGNPGGIVRAFDALGELLWSVTGQPATSTQRDVAVLTSGEVVATYSGTGTNDYDVARFSSAGVWLGQGRYGGSGIDDVYAIAAHPHGGYVVAGSSYGGDYGGGPLPGAGPYSGFIARHADNGNELWVVRFDQQVRTVTVRDVACLPSGQIVGIGISQDPLAAYPNTMRYSVDASGQNAVMIMSGFGAYQTIDAAADGTYVATGSGSMNGFSAGFIEKFSSSGAQILSISFPAGFFADSYAYSATIDETGGVYAWVLDGTPVNGGSPAFNGLMRFSAAGVKSWEMPYPHTGAHTRLGRHGDLYVATRGPVRTARFSQGALGAQLCAGQPNSTGAAASTYLAGSASVNENELVLFSESLPPGQSVLYLVADGVGSVPNAGGSQGTLCLGNAIGRYNQPSQVAVASATGVAHLGIDLSALPGPVGFQGAVVGQTWNFQAWYRDVNPSPTSNFTSAVSVVIE